MTPLFARMFGTLIRIDPSGAQPPWPVQIWNKATATWDTLGLGGSGGSSGGNGKSSPLIAPGPAPLAAEMVCLPGDPPDPVTIGGDYVWLRRHAPDFTLSPSGDLTIVEGRD